MLKPRRRGIGTQGDQLIWTRASSLPATARAQVAFTNREFGVDFWAGADGTILGLVPC